jgi:thiamine monophosphate kinase/tetratricopeptide (TPR) repeat protein
VISWLSAQPRRTRKVIVIEIFLSFGLESTTDAEWLAERLRSSGHAVFMEDAAGPRSPRHELARSIRAADLVLSIVTPRYAVSEDSDRVRQLARAVGKQMVVVFAGLSSSDRLAEPYSGCDQIELPGRWDGSRSQWARIAARLDELIAKQQRHGLDVDTARQVTQAVLLYDLEDQRIGHKLLRARPGWRRYQSSSATDHDDKADLVRILLWSKATMEPHSLVRKEYERAVSAQIPVFILLDSDTPMPPGDQLVIPVTEFLSAESPSDRARVPSEDPKERVKLLLSQAHSKNHECPLDVLNDRFCLSSEVGDLLAEAYFLATAELHEAEFVRLQAVYRYALALRFFGDWRRAVERIDDELSATHVELQGRNLQLQLRLRFEKLVLEYELGDHKAEGIEEDVQRLQSEFRDLDDLVGYVQAGRVLGNVLRVRGKFNEAERVFQRTIGVAEYLAESTGAGGPSLLLVADCHRELAGLYIARWDTRRAAESLSDARQSMSSVNSGEPVVRYLSAVLDYVEASLAQGDDVVVRATAPIERVQSALETLLAFENPIRIAQVYNWLGLAWARQIPRRQEDLKRGEEYLQKALRIRKAHRQKYTCGLSHLNLGELYEAADDLDACISHYDQSREIFNSRGLPPALAKAHASLARAYARKSIRPGDEAGEQSRKHLIEAERRFNEIGLQNEALELRYELEHSGRRRFSEVDDDTPLIAVGEYLLHEWIREEVDKHDVRLPENIQLVVGVGDDAAVLSNGRARPGSSFVFTTDAAPGSLARLGKQPEYVGRFAVIQTLADILAMGARPVALLANVFLNRSVTVGYVRRSIGAILAEAAKYGVAVIGGDIKERDEQSIGCVGIGLVDNRRVLRRDAARPGQALGITLAAAPDGGKRLIGARWAQELLEYYKLDAFRTAEEYPDLKSVLDPNIKSDLLYVPDSVMKSATRTGALRAAIDTSDGVLACLEILGRESNVAFELDEYAIEALIDRRAQLLANALDLPPAAFLFSAGHDWEIVFTCEERLFAEVQKAVDRELQGNGAVAKIGMVVTGNQQNCAAITLRRKDGQSIDMPFYTDEKFVPRTYQDRPSQWLTFASRLRAMTGAQR